MGLPRAIVSVIDNDAPGVMIISSGGSTEVVEGGSTDTYQVVLTYPPTQDVTIHLEHVQGQLTAVNAAQPAGIIFLTFTPSNWSIGQTVLVTAIDDSIWDATYKAYVSHMVDTTDPDYQDAFALQELVVIREPAVDVDRRVFYNNSRFDGNDPAAAVADDGAIAPSPNELLDIGEDAALGKTALLPGQTATFQNYTSYDAGINGIMIDVDGLAHPELISAADFEFRVGNDNSPAGWELVATDASVSVREGAGAGGSDHITITWPDGSSFPAVVAGETEGERTDGPGAGRSALLGQCDR